MGIRRRSTLLGVGVLAAASLLVAPVPLAALPIAGAAPCPDIEIVFARGRLEPPGPGQIGYALAADLRAKTKRTVSLYAVNYPANTEVDIGANDVSLRIQSTAANCPGTRIVVGGYSLGAAVSDLVLAVPISFFTFRNPLPPAVGNRISAIALFGNGAGWMGPISTFNPVYRDRTIEMCHGDDPICTPTNPKNWQSYWPDHLAPAYIKAGMVDQAADFVARRV